MVRSVLVCALLAFRIYFIDPGSIRALPIDLVAMLLKECFQRTIFDAIIAA
jgi:hypothetical protein